MAFYRDDDGDIWVDDHCNDGLRCVSDSVRGVEGAGTAGVLIPRSVVETMCGPLVRVVPTWEDVE